MKVHRASTARAGTMIVTGARAAASNLAARVF
jgi:hypothetical protein